jgi:hypothetical protein
MGTGIIHGSRQSAQADFVWSLQRIHSPGRDFAPSDDRDPPENIG